MVRGIPYLMLGLISLPLQVIVLREMLGVSAGNELDIGITLSLWLVFVGLGSLTGWKIRLRHAFGASMLLAAFLMQPTIVAIKSIRAFSSLAPGETLPLGLTFLYSALTMSPLCITIGLQFPLAVSYRDEPPARVYGLEAAGAFAGGAAFTFIVSGRLDSHVIALLLSILSILAAVYITRKKFLFLLLVFPIMFHYAGSKLSAPILKGMDIALKKESRYGGIVVLKDKGQWSVYQSGGFIFSYPEPQTEELRAHMPMSLHPEAKSILVVGGSPGTLREFLKYPIERLDFTETDPALISVSLKLLNEDDKKALSDRRLRLIAEDGRKFIKGGPNSDYDLIALNLPPPSTANMNRFFTYEFFGEAKKILKKNGTLALTLHTSSGYMGRRMLRANSAIYHSLGSKFRYVASTSQEYGWLFASESPIMANLETARLPSGLKYFNTSILDDAFSPPKAEFFKGRLEALKGLNTDMRPAAYLYALMLWAETHGASPINCLLEASPLSLLTFGALILSASAVLIFKRKKRAVYGLMFTAGFAGMGFSLVVILCYQAFYGYIYEAIGLISALFMAGIWAGTSISKGASNPIKKLFAFEAGTIALAALMPFLFRAEVFFYAVSFIAGLITGRQFAFANISLKGNFRAKEGGRLYAIELAGSFIGALFTAIFLVPAYGVKGALCFIIALKAFSAAMLYTVMNEKD